MWGGYYLMFCELVDYCDIEYCDCGIFDWDLVGEYCVY